MAKKNNTGAIIAGVVGVGALGLGAVMLSQQKTGNNKENTSLFSGVSGADSGYVGGGMTGGYGEIITPSETVTPSISDTIAEVLTQIPQPQIQYAIPESIIPQIQEVENPADETADVKQTDYTTWQNIFAAGGDIVGNLQAAGWNISQPTGPNSKTGQSNAAQALIANINADKGAGSSSSAVEYSPFNFAPTSKQADYSSYNAGKTGGSAANTPATPAKTPTTPAKTPTTPTTPAKTPTTPTTSSQSMAVTSPVQTALGAFSSAVGAVANNVGSFLSGFFGR